MTARLRTPHRTYSPANNDGCAISETEQTRFKQIETFLEKDIYKPRA